MTKLHQRLDPQTRAVLLSLAGAEAWLSQFPAHLSHEIGTLTAGVLESPVSDDLSEAAALETFVSRFTIALGEDPELRRLVHAHWARTGQAGALSVLLSDALGPQVAKDPTT